MSLKYYPQTQIRQNLYTRGGEFTLSNGASYTGKYYITSDGGIYAGANPATGTNQSLTAVTSNNTGFSQAQSIYATATSTNSLPLTQTITKSDLALTTLTPYYPTPLPTDYARGYFTRYFAKYVTGTGYVVEISQTDWTKIQNGQVSSTSLGYLSTNILWQLTGPLHNTRVSQYQIIGGVYDTNKRTTEAAAVNFVGLVAFIGGNYTKFAQITPNVATSGSK